MTTVWRILTVLILISLPAVAEETPSDREGVVLFDFQSEAAAKPWRPVNDGVMGGRSEGRFEITEENTLRFFGNLSLENNGGFASVRARSRGLPLEKGDALLIRVRGDGRKYAFNLYVPRDRTAFSYRAEFQTKENQWQEIMLPLDDFTATWFGRTLENEKLNPREVSGVGILLGDKKPGPFELHVDWVKLIKGEASKKAGAPAAESVEPARTDGG